MEEKDFILECIGQFERNEIECSQAQAKKLYILTERMLEVNKFMNLTSIKEEKAIILRHYIDSMTISKHIPHNCRVMDIGCGAGFPTLPLAIFRPDLRITALDGTAKRIRYVSEAAELLELSNVCAISGRAEEFAHMAEYRECFDVVTARAVSALPVLCELCLPYVKLDGIMIAMKSQQAETELAEASRCIELCGGTLSESVSFNISDGVCEPEQRNLIIIKKTAKTSKIYPRHFSKISKKHL